MLKKVIIATLLLSLIFSLVACTTGENRVTTTGTIESKAPTADKAGDQSKPNNQEVPNITEEKYTITKLYYSKSDDKLRCTIKYPEISGLNDIDNQKKINTTLKDEALKVLNYYEDSYGSVELNIDYKIVYMNQNILSIQYSGLGSVSNAAHPNNLFFTTNIDIKTGERLRLKDIVNIDQDFANKFLNGEFKALWPEQSVALKHYTNDEIRKYFLEADSLDSIGTDQQSDVFSYFTDDSLGISISVGHAIGDHAEFKISYKNIKGNIKTENKIWDNFSNLMSIN